MLPLCESRIKPMPLFASLANPVKLWSAIFFKEMRLLRALRRVE